jgi:hypothetical protein
MNILQVYIEKQFALSSELERLRREENQLAGEFNQYAPRKRKLAAARCYLASRDIITDEIQKIQTKIDTGAIDLCKMTIERVRKTRKLKKEICGICMETHDHKHVITTTCGRLFGKYCFAEMIKFHYKEGNEILHCPLCRSHDFGLLYKKPVQQCRSVSYR